MVEKGLQSAGLSSPRGRVPVNQSLDSIFNSYPVYSKDGIMCSMMVGARRTRGRHLQSVGLAPREGACLGIDSLYI
jgi:hypothetical protein